MNGANAEPCVRIISPPNNTRKITMGKSHHFFRIFKKTHNSETIDNLLIYLPCNQIKFET